MRILRRMLAMFLCMGLLSMQVCGTDGSILTQRAHEEVPFSEIAQQQFSMEDFEAICTEITTSVEQENGDALPELLQELKRLYQLCSTELTLTSIRSSQDVTDTAVSEHYLDLLAQSYEVETAMSETLNQVADSPLESLLDWDDPVFWQFSGDYEPLTETEENLYYEEQRLIDQYYMESGDPITVELGGKTYTESELYNAYLEDEITWEDYNDGAEAIAVAQNDVLAPIYVALVENRKEQAALAGYSDYAEMQDTETFGRDYTRAEIASFASAVKRYVVPVAGTLYDAVGTYGRQGLYETTFSEEELLSLLPKALGLVSEELVPAADDMLQNGYYDIAWSDTKQDGAYTTYLDLPGVPFLFMQPYGDSTDFSTVVHEFGHYNAYACAEDPDAANIDLAEIHSQGLELLMLGQYDDIFGFSADAERLYKLYDMLTSLIDGCMMDELERYAYSTENVTVEQLNAKYMELLKDYGYREASDEAEAAYSWVTTAHLFGSPLYYISYAVSAAGAFSIWEQSLTDYDAAVETYLRLVAEGERGTFFTTLNRVGLGNPISAGYIETLAETVAEAAPMPETERSMENIKMAGKLLLVVTAIPIVWNLLGGTVALIATRKRREET